MTVLDKFKLEGRVALVTGAARNLGKEIALTLAEAGANVVVTSRSSSELEITAEEIKAKGGKGLAVLMDVTDSSNVEQVVQRVVSEFGRIDILVNNAAARSAKPFLETPEQDWRDVFDTNLMGALFCCKTVGPVMIRQGGGRIINISSIAGVRGNLNFSPYCASKAALIQLTRTLALEWAPHHILVNSVAPGLLITPRFLARPKEVKEGRFVKIPLKRAADPSEIAPLVLYLASEACTYMTGQVVIIDGGCLAQ